MQTRRSSKGSLTKKADSACPTSHKVGVVVLEKAAISPTAKQIYLAVFGNKFRGYPSITMPSLLCGLSSH